MQRGATRPTLPYLISSDISHPSASPIWYMKIDALEELEEKIVIVPQRSSEAKRLAHPTFGSVLHSAPSADH